MSQKEVVKDNLQEKAKDIKVRMAELRMAMDAGQQQIQKFTEEYNRLVVELNKLEKK